MVITKQIHISSQGETDMLDITADVKELLKATKLNNGTVTVFVPGATGGLTTIEYEDGVLSDLKNAFERVAPRKGEYAHNVRWGDGNGFSHVRASLMGPSITIPFVKAALTLGTWQHVVFIDFDNRPRDRRLVVQFIGEK